MTYRQYYVKLIKGITNLEEFNEEQYQKFKADNEFLSKEDREEYKLLQDDLYSIMRKCEIVSLLLSNNEVKPTDELDPDILGFMPIDV